MCHVPLGDDLYVFGGDLLDSVLRRSPIGTSTVVLRSAITRDKRFPTSFSYGEDAAYWLSVTSARCVVFSTRSEVDYGRGVNIAAAAKWGSPSVLPRLYGEYRFHLAMKKTYEMDARQAKWSLAYRRQVSRDFLANLLHLVRRSKPVDWRCVLKFVLLHIPDWPSAGSHAVRRHSIRV